MVTARKVSINIRTGKRTESTFEYTPTPSVDVTKPVDLDKVNKVVKYAEQQGWI